MTKTISVFNQKGGVGKTTTNINLSTYLAKMGKKILVVDADPQGNTTSGLGIDKEILDLSLYDGLINEEACEDIKIKTHFENLDLVPSKPELAGAEIEMTAMKDREIRLRKFLEGCKNKYDFIFIDCPPSLGLISLNALAASDSILVPIQCEYYALEGVSQLMNTVNLVKRGLNNPLHIEGIIMTMFDGRTNLSLQVVDEVCGYFGEQVYKTVIPRNVRLAEAPSHGLSIVEYDDRSKGAEAYEALAKEFLGRTEMKQ
ncbi:ParA family protein [Alkalibacter rhizosphaerae]|uniref:Sporulation initiation inhibitor protein Soj n=1 Tax=Alkalibacter rhizosphaerae TaxID=2815577 RepID=A0A974XD02_9FIRM|nr:ParA family protein [Alkalibacter rhizosphaerae]QSX07572.1 ParA family protein [Alkalibacter rhizosphaerae]